MPTLDRDTLTDGCAVLAAVLSVDRDGDSAKGVLFGRRVSVLDVLLDADGESDRVLDRDSERATERVSDCVTV